MSDNDGNSNGQQISQDDWMRRELSEARQEAAGRRVENRDLTSKLDTSMSQVQTLTTQKNDAVARAEKAEQALLKQTVALSAGVPGESIAEFVDLLVGTTEDELKDSASKVLKFGSPQQPQQQYPGYDPSAGRGGAPANVPDTAEAQWLQWWASVQGTPLS